MDKEAKIEKTKESILGYLSEGMSKKDSAVLAGISEATFFRWISQDESFESRVEASILEYKHSLVKNVNFSAAKDGRLALEILARKYPKEWGIPKESGNLEEYEIRTVADEFRKLLFDKLMERSLQAGSTEIIPVFLDGVSNDSVAKQEN